MALHGVTRAQGRWVAGGQWRAAGRVRSRTRQVAVRGDASPTTCASLDALTRNCSAVIDEIDWQCMLDVVICFGVAQIGKTNSTSDFHDILADMH